MFSRIGIPFRVFQNQPGYFTDVQAFDVNRDGLLDLVFSGGRHTFQGHGWVVLQKSELKFQDTSVSFGTAGGYTSIGVLKKTEDISWFMLAGGSCRFCRKPYCYNGDINCTRTRSTTTAKLFAYNKTSQTFDFLWADPIVDSHNRGGTIAKFKGSDSIFLVGKNGLDIYEETNKNQFKVAYHQPVPNEGKQRGARYVGLSIRNENGKLFGALGGKQCDVAVELLKEMGGTITSRVLEWSTSEVSSVTNVHVADLDGDGVFEIVAISDTDSFIFALERRIRVSNAPILHGRVGIVGNFFPRDPDDPHKDIAIATSKGEILLFQHRGNLSFSHQVTLSLKTSKFGFEIRGLATIMLSNGLESIVAAVYNPGIQPDASRCITIEEPQMENGTHDLDAFPCHNAFIFSQAFH